VIKEFWRVAAF